MPAQGRHPASRFADICERPGWAGNQNDPHQDRQSQQGKAFHFREETASRFKKISPRKYIIFSIMTKINFPNNLEGLAAKFELDEPEFLY